jgi:DNA-binding CsgD family transcriptional regulator/predicted negative regulator of RcsB-dependent stress response
VRYWQGEYAAAIELRERAYAGFRARGETRYPARIAAYHLAFDYAAVHGNFAAANGWLERGRRLAAVSGDCADRGWVELACALATDKLAEKERHIAAATDLAQRFGDTDLEFDALAYAGVALVERGHIHEGMRRLDEAAAAAHCGEVKSHTAAGEIYCKMLVACEMVLDVRRAAQWRDAADSLAGRSNVAWASAICRMHYGGILTAAGRWAEAETELGASVRLYDRCYRALRSGAVVRLADLRVRQGRLQEAEQLLVDHEHDAYAVYPSARLHLARGEIEMAATLLRRHLKQRGDDTLSAPVLALLAEVLVAAGRTDEARAVAGRLTAIAEQTPVAFLRAFAEFVAGIVGDGDEVGAGHLEAALAAFADAGLPLEEARTRLELARMLSMGKPGVAIAEARAALAIFDRLGAAPDADAAAHLLRSLGARGRTGPREVGLLSKREQEVLQLLRMGLSNPEIAGRLFISRKTAAHHVSNVLSKLGLRNRAEAAAFAAQAGPADVSDVSE